MGNPPPTPDSATALPTGEREIARQYQPDLVEGHWARWWEEQGLFAAGTDTNNPQRFSTLLPPPNVTGTLHMGHGFNQTLMDALMRYHRMRGANSLWQVGTDHAGIATQIVVERQIEAQGTDRRQLGREEFLRRVWQWKEYSGNTIMRQMRRLGTACDWSRERFTLDAGPSHAVREMFVRLYRDGLIYRGRRLVNWDPQLESAVSDLEVDKVAHQGTLYTLHYPAADGGEGLMVATTRPETLFGDVAVAVHPDDRRYQRFIGQQLRLPLTGRTIPIIADSAVEQEFGSGCVKITPAHDFNDFEMGQRHHLPMISIFTSKAHLNEEVPPAYRGLERFAARKKVLKDLQDQGLLVSSKAHPMTLPICGRSGQVIEPYLTLQWFVAVNKPIADGDSLGRAARRASEDGRVKFVPSTWHNTYHQWLDHLQDWCISRQLWWGHRIPAWYDDSGRVMVAHNADEAAALWRSQLQQEIAATTDTQQKSALLQRLAQEPQLQQDNDVLDTWFSSALWPYSTLDWAPGAPLSPMMALYYPYSVLVTGFDILFFWVARMVMMCHYATGQVPFHDVYVHGLIRDGEGQKMSKSRGNVLDPLDLIDGITLDALLAKRTAGLMDPRQAQIITDKTRQEFPQGIPAFGADALRFTFASLASPGRDIKFDLARCEGHRNFCNKLWNAAWFTLLNCRDHDCALTDDTVSTQQADVWITSRVQAVELSVATEFAAYRFDLIAQHLHAFAWDEFCDWYIECAKVTLQQGTVLEQRLTRRTLLRVLSALLRLLHPLMPFLTEELWQAVSPLLGNQSNKGSILQQPYPVAQADRINKQAEESFARFQNLVRTCRNLRFEAQLPAGQKVSLLLATSGEDWAAYLPLWRHLARLSDIQLVDRLPADANPIAAAEGCRMALVLPENLRDQRRALLVKEQEQLQKEIARAQAKLDNENFRSRAPAHILAQEEERLAKFKEQLARLTN